MILYTLRFSPTRSLRAPLSIRHRWWCGHENEDSARMGVPFETGLDSISTVTESPITNAQRAPNRRSLFTAHLAAAVAGDNPTRLKATPARVREHWQMKEKHTWALKIRKREKRNAKHKREQRVTEVSSPLPLTRAEYIQELLPRSPPLGTRLGRPPAPGAAPHLKARARALIKLG